MKRIAVLLLAIALSASPIAQAAESPAADSAPTMTPGPTPTGTYRFAFAHVKGDKYRALSTVDEDVYINRRFSHSSQILNRIAFETADAAPDGSSGMLRGTFETSERAKGDSAYIITESYDSEFTRDRLGRYTIDPKYYMPVVRDVPTSRTSCLRPGIPGTPPARSATISAGSSAYPIPMRFRSTSAIATRARSTRTGTSSS